MTARKATLLSLVEKAMGKVAVASGETPSEDDSTDEDEEKLCVLTDYRSTLFYLAAEIENIGKVCHVLHDASNADSRQRTLAAFSSVEEYWQQLVQHYPRRSSG